MLVKEAREGKGISGERRRRQRSTPISEQSPIVSVLCTLTPPGKQRGKILHAFDFRLPDRHSTRLCNTMPPITHPSHVSPREFSSRVGLLPPPHVRPRPPGQPRNGRRCNRTLTKAPPSVTFAPNSEIGPGAQLFLRSLPRPLTTLSRAAQRSAALRVVVQAPRSRAGPQRLSPYPFDELVGMAGKGCAPPYRGMNCSARERARVYVAVRTDRTENR